ncbi:hypothetical protein YC2023_018164 [Brassica napus]
MLASLKNLVGARLVDRASSSSWIHSPAITFLRSDYSTSSPLQLPPFDYQPWPYNSPYADEVCRDSQPRPYNGPYADEVCRDSQRDTTGLSSENTELKHRLQVMEQQAKLRDGM